MNNELIKNIFVAIGFLIIANTIYILATCDSNVIFRGAVIACEAV